MSAYDAYLVQTFGPWIIVLILVLRELVPFMRDRLFPAYMSSRDKTIADRRALDERQVIAQENQAKALQQIAILFGTINDRTEITAVGMQRVERLVTEINVRVKEPSARNNGGKRLIKKGGEA